MVRRVTIWLLKGVTVPLYAAPRWLWRGLWPTLELLDVQWMAFLPWVLLLGLIGGVRVLDAVLGDLPDIYRPLFISVSPSRLWEGELTASTSFFASGSSLELQGPALQFYRWALGAGLYSLGGFALSASFGAPLHIWGQGLNSNSQKSPRDKTHGSASWETVHHAKSAGFLRPKDQPLGLLLGRVPSSVGRHIDPRYQGRGHILTCAPTGSGKGIGCVIPNLLHYPGSVFVLDIKGENYAATARQRLRMGQEVLCFDPFEISDAPSQSCNWLSLIDVEHESCVSDAAQLAEALVVRSSGHDSHWDDSAQYLLQGMILYVASMDASRRHMGTLREMLTFSREEFQSMLESLSSSPLAFGRIGRMARAFAGKDERERASVLSTALRHTNFLDDPRVERVLRGEGFDFRQLKIRPITVYLIVPPDKLAAYARFIRATLVLALRAMVQQKATPPHDVVFLLDEVAQLGAMPPLEDAVAIMRGYHVRLWLLLQDLGQIKSIYPKWTSFLASSTLQFFGVQDNDTARYVSEALGNSTVWVRSRSHSSKQGGWAGSRSQSSNISATGRPLLTPEEVRTLPATEVLVFSPGRKPQRLQRLNYLRDSESQGLYPLQDAETNKTTPLRPRRQRLSGLFRRADPPQPLSLRDP